MIKGIKKASIILNTAHIGGYIGSYIGDDIGVINVVSAWWFLHGC